MQKLSLHLLNLNKFILLLLTIGTITWSLTMFKSGLIYDLGMGFWGPNGHDGVWHIALANSLAKGSLEMPTFAGQQLQNYHIGFDLLLAFLYKITQIPIHNLYFQILPPLIALLTGISTYLFVIGWRKSKKQALWATYFVYFGGSWGWLFGKGESMFWSQQSLSTLINPPFALSLLFLLSGLIMLQKKRWVMAAVLFALTIQVKVYAGALILGSLLISGIYTFLTRKDLMLLKTFILSLPLSILLFLPLNSNSGSLLVWQPFWFLETMMGLSDRVGWSKFYEAMMNYKLAGNHMKLLFAYLSTFIIFILGNFGLRTIKIVHFFNSLKNLTKIECQEIVLLTAVVIGILFPMFFVQAGTPWNTIQFFYYSLIFSGVLAGITVGEILENKNVGKIIKHLLITVLILVAIPTTWSTLQHYLPSRPPAKLSNRELEALNFLKEQPTGVVLTYPYDMYKAKEAEANPPRPLYLYESTAYVSAFSNKTVYLEDEVNSNIMNYDWMDRRLQIEQFYKSLDHQATYSFLRNNNIKYVYWVKPQRATVGDAQLGLIKVFENEEVEIYKVKE